MKEGFKTILFTGELHADVETESVIAAMAKRLRITPEIAHKIVDSGKPRRLKRGLTDDRAITYQDVLEGLGLHTQIVDESPGGTSESPDQLSEAQGELSEAKGELSEAQGEPSEVQDKPSEAQGEPPASHDTAATPSLATSQLGFSPGIWGWTLLVVVGLLVAASVLVEALVGRDQTIPLNATTFYIGAWAVGGVLSVALTPYLLGWLVWRLGKRKSGGGRMVFCLLVLVVGAGVVWINAEKLFDKIEHVRDQRTRIAAVQTAFDSMLSERSEVYNQAAKGVDLNVGAITQRQDIDEMRDTLSAFLDASTKLGVLQLEGDKYLSAQLTEAGVEPHRMGQIINDYRARNSANQSFNTATLHSEAEVVNIWMDMLDLLESSWGRWEPDPKNSSILTEDTALQESYNNLVERLANENRKAPQSPAG